MTPGGGGMGAAYFYNLEHGESEEQVWWEKNMALIFVCVIIAQVFAMVIFGIKTGPDGSEEVAWYWILVMASPIIGLTMFLLGILIYPMRGRGKCQKAQMV